MSDILSHIHSRKIKETGSLGKTGVFVVHCCVVSKFLKLITAIPGVILIFLSLTFMGITLADII
jgi:hypothetical protein